jgi:hypothetical protein
MNLSFETIWNFLGETVEAEEPIETVLWGCCRNQMEISAILSDEFGENNYRSATFTARQHSQEDENGALV